MEELSKRVTRQDANFKLSPCTSNETSINIPNEISDFISKDSGEVTFKLLKDDFIKAISTLCLHPKLYLKKSQTPSIAADIFSELYQQIIAQFGDSDSSSYAVNILKREDGRNYLNSLNKPNGFNFRSFLVEQLSEIVFSKDEGGQLTMRLNSFLPEETHKIKIISEPVSSETAQPPHLLSAIRTKPFILLAGISGTGKSRIVREFAFKSCPKFLQDEAGTTPGNYCMIEVKPNWHDSTELLGYYSRLGNSPGYQFTKFVKFLVKAKMYPSVPFFVCLDEMNLAPVEQYFAEILSILETRKSVSLANGERTIKTGAIIEAVHFRDLGKIGGYSRNFTDRDIFLKLHHIATENDISEEVGSRADLTTEGLTLPDNVIIVGTVNMDDTTHQFSRKVIDRAMTIEMNGGNLRNMFGGSRNLEYLPQEQQEKWQNAFSRQYVTADEVLAAHPDVADTLMDELPSRLEEINKALKGTPFEVSYRVLNELTIMVGVLLDEGKVLNDAIAHSVNNILLMKILPRIEGDTEMFALAREYKSKAGVHYDNRLEWLKEIAPDINEALTDSAIKAHQPTAKEKIQEMIDRLNNQEFTRFWP